MMLFALIIALILSIPGQLFSQNVPITGKITDATTGQPVAGASVRVKGTSGGVATDSSGIFHINAARSATLIVSYVGYESRDISAAGNLSGIQLKQTGGALADVVVVGYGTQKKTTLTGAVSVVTAKTFEDRGPIASPVAALQGQVAGVVVTRSSAAPGRESWNFQIRGATSLNGSDPLIIIDGIPVSTPLNNGGGALNSNPGNGGLGVTMNSANALGSLNPSDIENISVLKDAAASIYGSRAAGGVVLITTKRGKSGKPTLQYEGTVSTKIKGLNYNLASGQQWGQGIVDAITNDYFGNPDKTYIWYKMGRLMTHAPDSGYLDFNVQYSIDPATGKPVYVGTPTTPAANGANPGFGDVKDITFFNTNWNKILWGGGAVSTTHNLSLSGRTEKSGYRLSLRYSDDGSLLKWGDNSNKLYNVRLANDWNVTDKLKVETNLSFEENDIVMPTTLTNGNVLGNYMQPGFPIATKTGMPYAWGTQYDPNWQAKLGGNTKEGNMRIYTNLGLTYSFSKHLRFVGKVAYDPSVTDVKAQQKVIHWWNYNGSIQAPDAPTQLSAYYQRQSTTDKYYNLNGYLEYHNTFAADHDLTVVAGSQYERDMVDYYSAKTTDLTNDNVPSLNLSIGDATTKSINEQQSQWALGSYFGRLNYAYKGKYLFEAQARYDGSSRFIAEDRWKMFYGFSAGWRIIDEEFMKSQSTLSDLKLRASWGQVGNQSSIGLYDYINTLGSTVSGGSGSSGVPILGSGPVVYVTPNGTLVSQNRTWETVQNENLGVDFGFLSNRLTGSFDYYIKNNTNMLIGITYPSVIGANAPPSNSGHLRTWGWETVVGWRDQIGKFTYHVGATISENNNKLVTLTGASVINPGYNTAVQGYAIGSIFGLKYAGRIQDQKTADAVNAMGSGNNIGLPIKTATQPGARMGDNYYVDVNKDGKLTTPGDLVYLGRDDPKYVYSFNLGGEFHGFDLSAVFQGVLDRAVYRGNNVVEVPYQNSYQGEGTYWVGNTWTPNNTKAFYPNLSASVNGQTYNAYNYQPSSWAGTVQNGAYLRLKNLVLGYTIPQPVITKLKLQRVRVYFSGQDLWEKTGIHDGWDPEATRTISNLERYPFYRYLTFGLNVTF
jgi:TonB-linked SusC/RagA family outer membrane protein